MCRCNKFYTPDSLFLALNKHTKQKNDTFAETFQHDQWIPDDQTLHNITQMNSIRFLFFLKKSFDNSKTLRNLISQRSWKIRSDGLSLLCEKCAQNQPLLPIWRFYLQLQTDAKLFTLASPTKNAFGMADCLQPKYFTAVPVQSHNLEKAHWMSFQSRTQSTSAFCWRPSLTSNITSLREFGALPCRHSLLIRMFQFIQKLYRKL